MSLLPQYVALSTCSTSLRRTIELCIVASTIDNIHQYNIEKIRYRIYRKAIIIDKEKNLIRDLIDERKEREKT